MSDLALICTGFHRSATSATAKWIHEAGLHMGTNLIGKHISNLDGHFEDKEVVDIHDSFLRSINENWQYSIDSKPISDIENIIEIERYIESRFNSNKQWGLKDPRACLFLDDWNRVLGNKGYFLFNVRHWTECIYSLKRRHIRELASWMPQGEALRDHLRFWTEPQLAAKSWLAYNERILKFVKNNPDNSLICTQRGLFENNDLIERISEFGFHLSISSEKPYDQEKLISHVPERILSNISSSLRLRLDSCWNEIIELAHSKSKNERVEFINAEKNNNYNKTSLKHRPYKVFLDEVSKGIGISFNIDNRNEFIDYIKNTKNRAVHYEIVLKVVERISDYISSDSELTLLVCDWLYDKQHYKEAQSLLLEKFSMGDERLPYILCRLGDINSKYNKKNLAIKYYEKSISLNPNNPYFYNTYSRYMKSLGDYAKAREILDKGIHALPSNMSLKFGLIDLLLDKKDIDEANNILNAIGSNDTGDLLKKYNDRIKYEKGLIDLSEYTNSLLPKSEIITSGKEWVECCLAFFDSKYYEDIFLEDLTSSWESFNINWEDIING